MAKKAAQLPENVDERDRPLKTMIALVVGFLVILGIAIGTVLVPELADDAGEGEEGANAQPEAPPVPAAAPTPAAPPST